MALRMAKHIQIERNCPPSGDVSRFFIDGEEFPFFTGVNGWDVHLERHSRSLTISILAEHIEVIDHAAPDAPQGFAGIPADPKFMPDLEISDTPDVAKPQRRTA